MDQTTQIQHFCNDLDKLIDRYASEFDLPYAAIVGSLQMKSYLLCQEALDSHNQDSDMEDDDE